MYEIFEQLLKRRGCRAADVAAATGLHPSTFSDWKRGKSTPKSDKRQRIADFFGVSLYYLDTGIDAPEVMQLSADRMAIFEPFLQRQGAEAFMKYCNDLNDKQFELLIQLARELAGGGDHAENAENSED